MLLKVIEHCRLNVYALTLYFVHFLTRECFWPGTHDIYVYYATYGQAKWIIGRQPFYILMYPHGRR